MTAFVDTSFFVALVMKRDQWHRRALRALRPGMGLVTSSLVVNETISLLQARNFFSEALLFLRELRSNNAIEILYPSAAVQSRAWDEFGRRGAAGANAVDCVTFALMKTHSLSRVLTFDRHFVEAGFAVIP